MGHHLGRTDGGVAGHGECRSDAGRGGPDQDDLVGVLAGRDLAAQDVEERVDGERRPAVARTVELRLDAAGVVGSDAQLADLDALAGQDLDVGRREVQALGGGKKRHGRHGTPEVIDQQGVGPHGAVGVVGLVQVADTGGGIGQLVDRVLAADGRERKAALVGNGALGDGGGQVLVRLALGLAEDEDRRNEHVARLGHAGGEFSVGIERLLGLGHDFGERLVAVGHGAERFLDLADVDQAAVGLRLEEERVVGDGLGLRARQLVDQFGVDVARPGPPPDVRDALVVDGDDGNPVRRLARALHARRVVETPLELLEKAGRLPEHEHGDHDGCANEPVRAPKLAPLSR